MYDLHDFLEPVVFDHINGDNGYNDGQFAKHITIYETALPDLTAADIILLGIPESRGNGITNGPGHGPDAIRRQLYQLHYWHKDVNIVDLGNIKTGATLPDSYAAVKAVLAE